VLRQAVDLTDHRREELLLQAEGHPPLPVYLLLPRREAAKCAGVLALHGHGAHGHHPVAGRDDLPGVAGAIKSANYDYGRQLVRRGYAVAVPCLTPFGPRLGKREAYGKQDPCAVTFVRLQLLGKVLMAENLRDCLWALELLARHPRVDAARLGCVGLSYGGRMAMLTAALEPRVRVAVMSGALNVMQERVARHYSCGAQVIPGLLEHGDVPEIGGLIAPRLAIWEVGSRDTLISPAWANEALARMRLAYSALGAKDRLMVDRFEGGHVWSGRVAYPQMEKVLGR
jgi:dienelactone hydrolase